MKFGYGRSHFTTLEVEAGLFALSTFDLRWPQLATARSRAWVPSQRVRPGHSGESTRS